MVGKSESESGGENPLDLFAKNTVANNKVTANLTAVIHEAAVLDGSDLAVGNRLYTVETKFPTNALVHRPVLLKYITSLKIKTPAQLEAAFSFLAATASDDLKVDDFEAACGVGVDVSLEDIELAADEILEESKAIAVEQRYQTNVGELFAHVRKKQPWAHPKIVKQIIDAKLYSLLGEKTAADNEKPAKKKKEKPVKAEEKAVVDDIAPAKPSEEEINPFSVFPSPEENFKVHTEVYFSDGHVFRASNNKAILEKHLKVTGGKVFTWFPPEPNGYLHIGHGKAMFVDFGLAKERGGCCYLRYDDTNPEAVKKEYIDPIEEIVGWMGWEPFKITYTSDYFQELYELAVELIRRGHAYVDHRTRDEIKEYREKKMNSPWRDRPIEESLKLFDDIKQGLIEEGKATLRMKQDMQSDNFNMYDLIAYCIKFTPHPHAGDKWCIYPSYDCAHCIVDSLENITHSLCTLEFETRRASYYWLLDASSLYQPYVWEYSRLNITNTVMSKHKLNRLVTENWVDGWDDPRLMTLAGLKRRGVTATAINAFVRGIGITRSDCSMIRLDRLEYNIREELNKMAAWAMVVLNPIKVATTNMKASVIDPDAKKWPDAPADDASSFYKTVQAMVQQTMQYIDQTPDIDTKIELIKTLNNVSAGKIYVEIERARLIKKLATIKEEQGLIAEAANLMQEIAVETFGAMAKTEKMDLSFNRLNLKAYTEREIFKIDRISELPDDILIHILSFLTMKQAGKTSMLSKRWRYVWSYIQSLYFENEYDYDDDSLDDSLEKNDEENQEELREDSLEELEEKEHKFSSWVDQVVRLHKAPTIEEFNLTFTLVYRKDNIDNWLRFAVDKRVKRLHLDVENLDVWTIKNPTAYTFPSLPFSNSLNSLKLAGVRASGEVLENLLRDCQTLEFLSVTESETLVDLKIVGPYLRLKSLEIIMCLMIKHMEIYAPNLEFLHYDGPKISSPFKSIPKLAKLTICGEYANYLLTDFRDVSSFISQIEELTILPIFEIKCMTEVFPICTRVKTLDIRINPSCDVQVFRLRLLLNACPFLHKFVLKWQFHISGFKVEKTVKTSNVEACPHYHLKIFEIAKFVGWEIDTEFIMYLIESAVSLEKMIIEPTNVQPPSEECGTEWKNRAIQKAEMLHSKLKPGTLFQIREICD